MENLSFQSEYDVIPPAMTISNTDLNIMYRGYDNNFTISVPGVTDDSKIRVSVSGGSARRQGKAWIIKPSDGAKTVTITVDAEKDGRMQRMGSQDYRVKALPDPQAFFSAREKEYASGNIALSTLTHNSGVVTASYGPDGLLNLPFKVTSFRAIINGMTTNSHGNKFTPDQINQINKLKKGGMVVLQDIRAVGPGGQEKRLAPLVLTLN
jgi:gliding motility-associated protein GldM